MSANLGKSPLKSKCAGCGLVLPAIPAGVTHAYIGASAACWALYGEVLMRRYDSSSLDGSALLVDVYAVQHPGVEERRAINSVATHLLVLYGFCEFQSTGAQAMQIRRAASTIKEQFVWLEPPSELGQGLTIADVHDTTNADNHITCVKDWAHEQWHAWKVHHQQVIAWGNHLMQKNPEMLLFV